MYNREYFLDKINKDGFALCDDKFKEEFEYYFDLLRVVDAERISKEDVDGILLIEENMDFRVLFLDASTEEYDVIAKYGIESDAFEEYSKIKRDLK